MKLHNSEISVRELKKHKGLVFTQVLTSVCIVVLTVLCVVFSFSIVQSIDKLADSNKIFSVGASINRGDEITNFLGGGEALYVAKGLTYDINLQAENEKIIVNENLTGAVYFNNSNADLVRYFKESQRVSFEKDVANPSSRGIFINRTLAEYLGIKCGERLSIDGEDNKFSLVVENIYTDEGMRLGLSFLVSDKAINSEKLTEGRVAFYNTSLNGIKKTAEKLAEEKIEYTDETGLITLGRQSRFIAGVLLTVGGLAFIAGVVIACKSLFIYRKARNNFEKLCLKLGMSRSKINTVFYLQVGLIQVSALLASIVVGIILFSIMHYSVLKLAPIKLSWGMFFGVFCIVFLLDTMLKIIILYLKNQIKGVGKCQKLKKL